MRPTSAALVVRTLPDLRERRATPPRPVPGFADQLSARLAANPPARQSTLGRARNVIPTIGKLPVHRGVSPVSASPGSAGAGSAAPSGRLPPADRTAPSTRGRGPERPAAPGSPFDPANRLPPAPPLTPARAAIVERAQSLLGVPYVWGGDTTKGLDCSSYISRAWGVSRQTTDTLYSVADPIAKDDLRAGDVMNLPTWRDDDRFGHVRMFDRWADANRTTMWVYEATSDLGAAVHRAIPYDDSYEPMRLRSLAQEG